LRFTHYHLRMLIDPTDMELQALRGLVSFKGQRVVEIGAGDGRLAWPLAPEAALWLALDPDADEVAAAANDLADTSVPPRVRLLQGDGRALPLPAGAFDLALFTWSLC
jgi:ubiquinone/menaquinone biosynthesis C-methylase UbiE